MASKTYYAYANGGTQPHYEGKVVFTERNDIANNQSTFDYAFYLYRDDGFTGSAHHFTNGNALTVIVNGTTLISSANYKTVILTGTSESNPLIMCSGSFTVPHNNDGTKSFDFNFTYDQTQDRGQELNYLTVAGTHICTTIARATTATLSISSVALGNSVTITTKRASDSFTHTIKYSIGSVSETIASNVTTSVNFIPPKDLANQFPNSETGIVTLTCTTYSGTTVIGTTTTKLTVVAPDDMVPTCDFTITEAASLPSEITVWVKNKSRAKINVSAAGVYGSTIKKYNINANETTYASNSATTGYLTTVGENTITVTVTDSRGRQTRIPKTINVYDYKIPQLSVVKAYRCDDTGAADDVGSFIRVFLYGSITSLNNQNKKTCTVYYKQDGTETWTPLSVALTSYEVNTTTIPFSASGDYAYNIHVELSDSFTAFPHTTNVPSAFTLGNFNPNGRGLAWGGVSQKNGIETYMPEYHYNTNEFEGDAYFTGQVYGNVYGLGAGIDVPSGSDANDYVTTGVYAVRSNDAAVNIANLPSSNAGRLIVTHGTGNTTTITNNTGWLYLIQEYSPYNSILGKFKRHLILNDTGVWTYGQWYQTELHANKQKVLWNGSYVMTASDTCTLSEPISDQVNGITLVFSEYSNSTAQNYHFNCFYIPKEQISKHAGSGHSFTLGTAATFNAIGAKYLYINNTTITGHANNSASGTGSTGIKYSNSTFVLRYVLGV